MNLTLTGLEFRPLHIPSSIDAEDGADFRAMVDVRNVIYREISGHGDHSITAAELLPHYAPNDYERRLSWLVLVDDRPVGRVGVDLPIEEGSKVAFVLIELLRDVWGQGIGTAALELVERVARENGRSVLQSWAEHPDAPGPRLEPPTGFGSIPAEDHGARWFVATDSPSSRSSATAPSTCAARSMASASCSSGRARHPPDIGSCSGSPRRLPSSSRATRG